MVRSAPSIARRCAAANAGWRLLACALVLCVGCSRSHYRQRADRDALRILAEKTTGTRFEPPPDYSIQPDPWSRLYDPTPIDDPMLPIPAPGLYEYQIPELPPAAFPAAPPQEPVGPMLPLPPAPEQSRREPAIPPHEVRLVGHQQTSTDLDDPLSSEPLATPVEPAAGPGLRLGEASEIGVSPLEIPQSVWQSIPGSCLDRMLEFQSVRSEYERSFDEPVAEGDATPRLSLEHIVELARLNSREYQTEKETLYRVALRLTLERFDYELKFAPFGNGTAVDYTHSRNGGITENFVRVPSQVQAERLLATGGDLIARFANDVVLTFDGPEGFAADVGSELLFDVSQTVFQRDVIFERLTQAERNVVYAARDFARFRKLFFFDLASRYYELLRLYRQIEIDTQNYFTLVRALRQREAEHDVGMVPRVQVDQVEQNALAARSSLIATCNRLEGALDALKIRMGLPTETPIGLSLTEIEQLTLQDQAAVADELVRRVRSRLQEQLDREPPDWAELLNTGIDLITRMMAAFELRSRLGEPAPDVASLRVLQARLQVDQARLVVRRSTAQLAADRQDPAATPLRILQRSLHIVDAFVRLLRRQEQLAGMLNDAPAVDRIRGDREPLERQLRELQRDSEDALEALQVERIPQFVRSAEDQLAEAQRATRDADALLQLPDEEADEVGRRTRDQIERLLAESDGQLPEGGRRGLVPVEIGMDEALLTALVERLDLMNERGFLADDWRQIKLAADDLKSILNLRATQRIRTESDVNRLLDFTFDESQTRVSATVDAPLNRRAQRNDFRERLLDYQAGRRRLMEREDAIKLAVRNDLRDLELTREQYALGLASAALAYERVVSTELQLRLEVADVSARDFLEAQTAFAQSLSVVAGQHISFLVTRARLFLDVELMELNARGFWPPLYDETHQPVPAFEFPPDAMPPYGCLPGRVHYSEEIQRMLSVPSGRSSIWSN